MRSLSAASLVGGSNGVFVTEPLPPTLIITGGPQDGASISCDPASGVEIIGSGEQSPVRLTLSNVSSVHAQIQWEDHQLFLEDAGSETGTYVNGEKITERRAIVEGDRIYLGPPGSANSASLLVCPPSDAMSYGGDLQLDAPDSGPSLSASDPLVLDPAPAAFDAPFELAPAAPLELPPLETPAAPLPLVPPPPPFEKMTSPAPPPAPSGTGSIRKPSKADYNTDIPSMIVPDRVREPIALPNTPVKKAAAAARKPARRSGPAISPAVLGGGAAAILLVAGIAAYFFLHTPPPVLSSVAPPKIEPGGTLTLTGEKFATTASRNTVHVGDLLGDVVSASATDISVRVPADAKP
jgi:hypothetical protein